MQAMAHYLCINQSHMILLHSVIQTSLFSWGIIFSHCAHLKLGHGLHALFKVCSGHDDSFHLI